VLPSFYEGNPKALLEAMSCGLPCVVSNIKEHHEFVIDHFNGMFCDFDHNSIKNTILNLSKNLPLRESISKNARETILSNYSLNKNIIIEKNIILCLI
jgi:glycosyltransferase involved in cell wall biosynthesis